MEKRTVGIIATIVVILLCGISGLFLAFAGGIPVLVSYIPHMSGASLTVAGSSDAPNFAPLSVLGSCCICIPIPLVFGVFVLSQQVNASTGKEPLP